MVDTIQEALNSFYLTTFIFGFGIFKYPLDYPRVRLSILYILCFWSIYAYIFYYVITFSWKRIIDFTVYFVPIINLLVTMTSIIITICKHKKYCILLNKLSQVDDTLEKLGTSKEYHRMRNLVKWIIIIWFIIICITWTIDSSSMIQLLNDTRAFIIPFFMNYTSYINTLTDIIFMFLLRYIGTRYDKINDHIRQLSEIEKYGLRYTWKKSSLVTHRYIRSIENRKRILWSAMHLHLQLCRIALNINDLFEMQMTLQTMAYFITLSTIFYIEYYIILCLLYNGGEIRWKFLLSINVWCVVYLIRLISLNYIFESVSAKAQQTEGIIHKLTNFICFDKAREEILQFILQITLRPLKFSGMGLFYFGHKFLCKFFIWVLSVVIFIIQMDTSPLYRTIFNRNNVTCYM